MVKHDGFACFYHCCNWRNNSPAAKGLTGRLQKNTHKRHGVRYKCTKCKKIAPKQVVIVMKLDELGTKL